MSSPFEDLTNAYFMFEVLSSSPDGVDQYGQPKFPLLSIPVSAYLNKIKSKASTESGASPDFITLAGFIVDPPTLPEGILINDIAKAEIRLGHNTTQFGKFQLTDFFVHPALISAGVEICKIQGTFRPF